MSRHVLAFSRQTILITRIHGIKKAWRTYLLFISLAKALALPNPVRMNNVRAHADMNTPLMNASQAFPAHHDAKPVQGD